MRRKLSEPDQFLPWILIAIPLCGLGLFLLMGWQFSKMFWGSVERGKIYQTHQQPPHPEIQIWMHGFMDSTFDVFLADAKGTTRIISDLPALFEEVGRTNREPSMTTDNRMYEVVWANNAQTVGIKFHGWLVAAYDRRNQKQVKLQNFLKFDGKGAYDTERCHQTIETMLKGQ
jgi:hypothetical protein